MQYLTILLGLVTSVSAIDIRLRSGVDCTGSYINYPNINPNTCCIAPSNDARYAAVGFKFIPTDWRIQAMAYANGGCSTLIVQETIQGRPDACLKEPSGFATLSGGAYIFPNSKKRGAMAAIEECSAASKCTNKAKPDKIGLADEKTEYSTLDMDEALVELLIDYAFNGTTADQIPQEFKAFEIGA